MNDITLSTLVAECAKPGPNTGEGFDALSKLAEALSLEPEFAGPRMVMAPPGVSGWNPQLAVQKMLSVLRNGRDAGSAVAWLRKVSSITKGTGGALKLMYGVRCTDSIAITDEVVLLPVG